VRRRFGAAVVAILAAVALTGCGPSEGTVVEKQYSAAEWYWTTCYRTETTTINGKPQSRSYPYSCQQYRPASYNLYLREEVGGAPGKHEPEAGWRSVGERVYMACKVGQYYRDGACTG
jgi:hypothetical protein